MNTGNAANYDASVALATKLAVLQVEDATATRKEDKKMIDDLICERGGFSTMNTFIRLRAKEAMGAVRSHFQDRFHELEHALAVEPI